MIFRSSVADIDLFGRDTNRDPDCYQANSVDVNNNFNNNNDNLNDNLHNSTDLSDGSLRVKIEPVLK